MLDNRVVDQTFKSSSYRNMGFVPIMFLKKIENQGQVSGMCIYILNIIDVFIKLHQNYLNFV